MRYPKVVSMHALVFFAVAAPALLMLAVDIKVKKNQLIFTDTFASSGLGRYPRPGGVAVTDYDGDGKLDVLITGEGGVHLYRGDGTGHFTDVTSQAGIPHTYAPSGVFGDFNNDGCEDLYLTGSDTLFKNNCDGTFTDVSVSAGIERHKEVHSGAASASWGDYDNDGYLDLYVTNHGIFDYVDDGHAAYTYDKNILYHNNGDGTFTNVTSHAGVSGLSNCGIQPQASQEISSIRGGLKRSFQPVWFDYNNDGYPDLFVSTDQAVSPLYRNNKNGTFTEVTKAAGMCRSFSNMGIAVGDFNEDGNMDLYVTNGEPNNLWRNNGDGTFTDVAAETATGDVSLTGWGTEFFDYDNDGLLDIYVVNGFKVEAGIYTGITPDRLYRNSGTGAYVDVATTSGIVGGDAKEKLALGDFDNDGFVDALVITATFKDQDQSRLYMNQGNQNHWLTVRLVGKRANRDGIGAVVTVYAGGRKESALVEAGGSYQAEHSLWQTFGLGTSTMADSVEVRWPGNTVQTLRNVEANRMITVVQE